MNLQKGGVGVENTKETDSSKLENLSSFFNTSAVCWAESNARRYVFLRGHDLHPPWLCFVL